MPCSRRRRHRWSRRHPAVAAPAGCSGRGTNSWTPVQRRRGVGASASTSHRRWSPPA
jgi:hypothetical protein